MLRLLQTIIFFSLISCIPMQKKQHVIFFGDSITELGINPGGYIMRIDSMCNREGKGKSFEFTGSGISGNKIYDLYLRMDDDVMAKNPDLVIIYIGVNDVWHKSLLGSGTDEDKFERFYQAIINKLIERKIKMILCTPAAIGEKTDNSNQQDGDLNQYSKTIRSLAQKNDLPLVDLRKAFTGYALKNNPGNKSKGILTYDGVHLNAKGNQLVADEMWKLIKLY